MDERLFTQLLLDSEAMLYRMACTLLRSDADRRDAMQETALKAWQNLSKLRQEQYFKTWIARILMNECHTILRKNMKVTPVPDMPDQAARGRQEEDVELRMILEKLPENQRVPIILHYLEGFSLKEIAAVQQLPLSMVKYLMYRGRKALQVELKEKEGEQA